MHPRVLICVPTYHAVEPSPFINFLALSQETGRAEAHGRYAARWMVPGPKVKTIIARNSASQISISGNADFLMFIDDDMVVPHNLVDNLIKHNVDIISPLFFRSGFPIEPLIFDTDELGNYVPIYDYPRNALFETPAGSGTGVMMIKTAVLKEMDAPIWRGTTDPNFGEDVDFCKRARKLGFKTWCDSSIRVRQMSVPVPIGEEHYRSGTLTR